MVIIPGKKRFKTAAIVFGLVVSTFVGSFLFIYLFGAMNFKVHGLSLKVSVLPSLNGRTVIELPPFGSLSSVTHDSPLVLHVRLERVGADVIKRALQANQSKEQLLGDIVENSKPFLRMFIFKQVVLGALGGCLLTLVIWRRPVYAVITGIVAAVVIAAVLVAGSATYRLESFREPEYDGVIALAPDIIVLANQLLDSLDEVQTQTSVLVNNIRTLFNRAGNLSTLGQYNEEGSLSKILIVSDLHSNPMGMEFIKSIVQDFKIQAILDAGDMTDYGSSMEAQFFAQLRDLGVPYYLSPGNHDTPEVINMVDNLENCAVLTDRSVEVCGIRVLGSPDPLANKKEPSNGDRRTSEQELREQANNLREAINKEGRPDLILVHNPDVAREVAEGVPVVVFGHTHRQTIEHNFKGAVLLNPGTVGGAGVRGLFSRIPVPYSAAILHLDQNRKPAATDFIQYQPLTGQISLERRLLTTEYGQPGDTSGLPDGVNESARRVFGAGAKSRLN